MQSLWIAAHLPQLSLEAFGATLAEPLRAQPLALVDGARIQAVNGAARRLGVQPGHKRATALALAPHLTLGQADAARDARALLAVAHAALAYTPMVACEAGTVLLEVQASLRYFGGADALLARLRAELGALGHRLSVAAAPTALGAALLAHWRHDLALGPHVADRAAFRRLLDAAPLDELLALSPGTDPAHRDALRGLGLASIGDLRRLPRAGLARRFGPALLDDLDRADGVRPDPREPIALPAVFESRVELFARADSSAQLLHAAAVLLARLVAWARARQARVAGFELVMQHDDAPEPTRLAIAPAEPSADAAHLQVLLRERLGALVLPAPTIELHLHCRELAHRPAPNAELFPTPASERESLVRLLDRLQARLGPQGVLRIVPVQDHRPERASVLQPLGGAPAESRGRSGAVHRARDRLPSPDQAADEPAGQRPAAPKRPADPLGGSGAVHRARDRLPSPDQAADEPAGQRPAAPKRPADPLGGSGAVHRARGAPSRPVWLLPEPLPLPERDALPLLDGRPLRLLCGPERIETGWWDGDPVTRDYYIACDDAGALLWVYRSRLPRGAEAGWMLQGRFA